MKRVSWQSGAKEYLKVTANKPNHFKKSHIQIITALTNSLKRLSQHKL